MLEGVDWGGGVGAGVCPHTQVGSGDGRLPGGGMVHGGVVDSSTSVLAGQRLDLLLQLLGVEAVVHAAPGVPGDAAAVDAHPGVVRETWVSVVVDVRLRRHVLHLLQHKPITIGEEMGPNIILKGEQWQQEGLIWIK